MAVVSRGSRVASTATVLTPGRRLSRGLKYTVAGPVDIARGLLGLGCTGARKSAAWVSARRRRPVLAALGIAAVLAGGGLAFFMIRRSARPEEPPVRPPSVDVAPRH